jgi:hypothetical protein
MDRADWVSPDGNMGNACERDQDKVARVGGNARQYAFWTER